MTKASTSHDKTDSAVEARGLHKAYGKIKVLDGIDLSVDKGTVFALLGPNGAGKTTIIRILATLLQQDAGTAAIYGYDTIDRAERVREHISLTGQFASVDDDLTGSENLRLIARLQGYSYAAAKVRASELLKAFGLNEAAARQVKTYSCGMRRRLDIAASIVITPALLFLDEPTTGLDPNSRNQVWSIVRQLVAAGTTVVLTTQYLDEADQLADKIAVLNNGKIIAEGTSSQLKSLVATGVLQIGLRRADDRARAIKIVSKILGQDTQPHTEPSLIVGYTTEAARAAAAISALERAHITVEQFSLGQPSLDEVFLALTKKEQ